MRKTRRGLRCPGLYEIAASEINGQTRILGSIPFVE